MAKTYVDTFTRANGNLAGSTSSDGLFTWAESNGTTFAIVSNALAATNIPDGTFLSCEASADCDGDNCYAEMDRTTYTRTGFTALYFEIVVSLNAAVTNGYSFSVGIAETDTPAWRLYRISTDTTLASGSDDYTGGTTFRVERNGSTVRALVDGVQVASVTNSAEATGAGNRRAGIFAYSQENSTNDLVLDNFEYGDLAGGTSSVMSKLSQMLS